MAEGRERALGLPQSRAHVAAKADGSVHGREQRGREGDAPRRGRVCTSCGIRARTIVGAEDSRQAERIAGSRSGGAVLALLEMGYGGTRRLPRFVRYCSDPHAQHETKCNNKETTMQNNLTPSNNLPALASEKGRSGIRLAASDPACLSPALARVDTGPCPEGDPRRVAAREEHERYARLAPPPSALDRLEQRAADGAVRAVRQESPGAYSFVRVDALGAIVDYLGGSP